MKYFQILKKEMHMIDMEWLDLIPLLALVRVEMEVALAVLNLEAIMDLALSLEQKRYLKSSFNKILEETECLILEMMMTFLEVWECLEKINQVIMAIKIDKRIILLECLEIWEWALVWVAWVALMTIFFRALLEACKVDLACQKCKEVLEEEEDHSQVFQLLL